MMSFMNRIILVIFVVLAFSEVQAIPRFAVRNGTSCNLCHVSPTGAGLRNDYGVTIFSMDELPMERGMKLTDEDYSGMIGDYIHFGADLRLQILDFLKGEAEERTTAIFPMQADIYGHLPVSKGIEVFVKVDLVRSSPEYWVKLNILQSEGYIQFGRKIPTYGLRLDDHTSFIRGGNLSLIHEKPDGEAFTKEGMPFSPRSAMPGIFEFGLRLSDFFFTSSMSNPYVSPSETGFQTFQSFSNMNYTARLEYSGTLGNMTGMAGSSVMKEQQFLMNGIFGGIAMGNITWLGEIDIAENWIENMKSVASYSELIIEPVQGINFIGKLDFFDEDQDFTGAAITRYTIGLEVFPMSFLEVKAQARFSNISGVENQPEPEYLVQLHTWF